MPSSRDSFRRNRVAPILAVTHFSISPEPRIGFALCEISKSIGARALIGEAERSFSNLEPPASNLE